MNRSIILAAVIISAAILLNGYLDRSARAPHGAHTSAQHSPVVKEKSIAVLPFENLGDDKQDAHFAARVQDEIVTNLSRSADLKVISRTSVKQYGNTARHDVLEIGKQLGVSYVVEGSVQRAANRVRVNVQLVDAGTDSHLWAETFDRDIKDVLGVPSEIAENIARALRVRLSPD